MSSPATTVAISSTNAIPSLPKKFNGSSDNWFLFKDSIINRLLVESDCCYQEILPVRPTDPTLVKADVEYRLPEPLMAAVARGGYSTEQYYRSTVQKRAKVLDFITNSLEDSIKITYASFNKPQVMNSPYNYWTALSEKYTHKTAAHIRLLENQLTNERLRETDTSLEQYLGRLNNLFSLLHDAGEPVSEKKKVRCLINGLPTSFNAVVTNLESQDNADTITLDEAITKVKRAFDRNRSNANHNDKGKEERRHNKAFIANNTNTNQSQNQLNEVLNTLQNALAVVTQSSSNQYNNKFNKVQKNNNTNRIHPYKTNINNKSHNITNNQNKYKLPCKFCKQMNPNHPYSKCDKAPTCHACNRKGHYANECIKSKNQSLIVSSENTAVYDSNIDPHALIVSSNQTLSNQSNIDEKSCKDDSHKSNKKVISIPLPKVSNSQSNNTNSVTHQSSRKTHSDQLNEILTHMNDVVHKISTIVQSRGIDDYPSFKMSTQLNNPTTDSDLNADSCVENNDYDYNNADENNHSGNCNINNKVAGREVIEIDDENVLEETPLADDALTPMNVTQFMNLPPDNDFDEDTEEVGDVEPEEEELNPNNGQSAHDQA